jgi:5-methylcytosine-specific restriction protein A
MPLPFNVGQKYTRNNVYEILDVPEDQRAGIWNTGYNRWKDDLFIFSTVGAPATGGYDYDNEWEEPDVFRWLAKNGTTLEQPLIRWMLNEADRVLVFTRPSTRSPYTFEGLATPIDSKDTSPVEIRWRINRNPPKDDLRTYLLTWTPKWDWHDYEAVVRRSRSGEVIYEDWSTGNTKTMPIGSRVFLLRQTEKRGIVGSGWTRTAPELADHWDGSDRQMLSVDTGFERLLSLEDRLPIEALLEQIPDHDWNNIQASGLSVPPPIATRLEALWAKHLKAFDQAELANEIADPRRYPEGATKRIVVNAYERNPAARAACIARFGAICAVCTFSFAAKYGAIGDGFIHVHHLRDLATIGEEYEVDPETDLCPVCPNCHAMLHTERPAMSIEKLREIIARQVSTPRQVSS